MLTVIISLYVVFIPEQTNCDDVHAAPSRCQALLAACGCREEQVTAKALFFQVSSGTKCYYFIKIQRHVIQDLI